MREACLQCARKHIGQAEVLMQETMLGYPLHAYLAIGHLAEAEAELLDNYPNIAKNIRSERVKYIDALSYSTNDDEEIMVDCKYAINTIELLRVITSAEILDGE